METITEVMEVMTPVSKVTIRIRTECKAEVKTVTALFRMAAVAATTVQVAHETREVINVFFCFRNVSSLIPNVY